MKNVHKFDVVLVGGGVMGCATAYYLLNYDPKIHIAIFEKDMSYERNSTVLSDGNIRLQFNLKENILISKYGLEMLKTFSADMTVGDWNPMIDFRQQGNLFLSDIENVENARSSLYLQNQLECQVKWMTPEEIATTFPLIDPAQIAGGTFGKLDGTMDPQAVLMGYKNKAIDWGAEMIQSEVTQVLHSNGEVTGVHLKDGTRIQSKVVLNCAGAWGAKLALTAGVDLPVEPVMRNVYIIETHVKPDNIYPLTVFPTGLYIIHEHGNRFLISKSFEEDPIGFDFIWNRRKFEDHLWPEVIEYIPSFDRLKVVGGWAGLYAVNRFDGNALLGEWPDLRGFYLANGFSGHGFQQCHAVGRYLAELILGLEHSIDLTIFSPDRILDNKPVFEGYRKLV